MNKDVTIFLMSGVVSKLTVGIVLGWWKVKDVWDYFTICYKQ